MSNVKQIPKNYKYIVETCLEITPDRLDRYKETIVARLDSAYHVMTSVETTAVNRDLFGINQCVHLASSIVLLDRTSETSGVPDALKKAIDDMRNTFPDNDPTTVLTMATLYYLLTDYAQQNLNQEQMERNSKCIREHLDAVNWLVGLKVMKKLEMVPL